MGIKTKSLLLVNTIKYLKLSQLVNQVKVRLKPKEQFWKYERKGVRYKGVNLWIKGLDDNAEFMQRFEPEKLLDNELTLLHETRFFDRWQYGDATHLWNFNVHYLEYCVPLYSMWKNTGDERYKAKINRILTNWYEVGSKEFDSNQPYTLSLRVINQLIISDAVDDQQRLYESIYAQYQFLIKHQEKHLLGNHYLENLKTIVICSLVFDEEKVYKVYIRKLLNELDEEITADGLHFELSLMYHKIVLEDLIRVAVLLKESQKIEFEKIVGFISRMCTALFSLEDGIRRTLLFNDAGNNVAKPTEPILRVCSSLFSVIPEKRSSIAGYHRLENGRVAVIADCGVLSPSYMSGHAHCDCLSYELFYDGEPVIVNSGTYQYQGNMRKYFRETSSHNTVIINEHEQSELWGEHRAGRRIKRIKVKRGNSYVIGECENYYGEHHTRSIQIDGDKIEILDNIDGKGKSYVHLAPGFFSVNDVLIRDGLVMKIEALDAEMVSEKSWYAEDIGKKETNIALTFTWEKDKKEHGYKIVINKENKQDD